MNKKIAENKSKSRPRDIVLIGSDDFLKDNAKGKVAIQDSPSLSPPKIIKVNGRDPSKEKKMISFTPVEDNSMIGEEITNESFGLRQVKPVRDVKLTRHVKKNSQEEISIDDF